MSTDRERQAGANTAGQSALIETLGGANTMLGLGKNDDEQRMYNLMLFKMYVTDKEIEEAMPMLAIVLVVILVLVVIGYWVGAP